MSNDQSVTFLSLSVY